MRYLTSEHWVQFQAGTAKGIAFENLVQRLLPTLIPGRWIRTKPSWDRARDFWRRHNSKTVAAECKFYRDPISLKVLSNTLVMAIVDDLACILFFSHSRLNQNTLSHLTAYSEQTGKSIEVYDDEKLERLILATPRAMRLFPRFKGARHYPYERSLILTEHISRDPDVEYLDIAAHNDTESVPAVSAELYETVALDIFLTNDTLEPIMGTIVIDQSSANGATLLLDKDVRREQFEIPFKIPRAGVFGRRLYFKIMKPGLAIPLPSYSVHADGLVVRDLRTRKPLEVPALLRPPLIGRLYHAIQRDVRRLISARETIVSIALQGASGTGKSRLLDELRDDFVAEGYTVYRFRGENSGTTTFDDVLRKYVAKRYRLPLSLATEEHERRSPRRAFGSPLVHRILYEASYRPSDHVAECRQLVFLSLQKTKAAFFIDDLQSFDDTTVAFFNELVSRGSGANSCSALVFTINTDLATKGSSCMKLLERLDGMRHGAGRDAPNVMVETIPGFSKPDARSYLDHCFAVPGTPPSQRFAARYGETAGLFLEHVPLNPLFIEQFLRYLLQKDIIGRDGDILEVHDSGAFNDALRHAVPDDISTLLERRWEFVRGKVGAAGEDIVDLLALFVYLPLSVAMRWRIPQPILYKLRDYGLVRIDERKIIVFYHQLFFRYFKQRSHVRGRTWARRVLSRFDASIRQEYPAQYVVVLEQTRSLAGGDVRFAIETVERDAAALEYLTEFTDALLRATSDCDARDRGRLLKALRASGQRIKSRAGFGQAFDMLRRTGERELSRPELYRKYGDAFMRLALGCANIHVTVREDYGAAAILEDALGRFDDFRFKGPQERSELLCAVLDRLCVAMRSLSNRDEALRAGRRAEAEAAAARLPHMQMQAHIDMGYVYYGRLVDRKELLKHWSTALRVLPPTKIPSAPVTGPNVWRYHNTHVLALRGKLDEAADAIAEAEARTTRELDTFHLVKLLSMNVVVALMREGPADYARLERTTDRIIDLCVRHDARQTYWVGLHARAKVAERRRNAVGMGTATKAAFRQLMAFAGAHPEMQERYHEAMLDLAIMARKARRDLPPEQVAQIATIAVRSEVETILRSTDAAFRAYRRRFRPLSTYHDGRFDLPCP